MGRSAAQPVHGFKLFADIRETLEQSRNLVARASLAPDSTDGSPHPVPKPDRTALASERAWRDFANERG